MSLPLPLQLLTQRTPPHSLKPNSSITASRMASQVLPGCNGSCLWSPWPCFPLHQTCLLPSTPVEGDHDPQEDCCPELSRTQWKQVAQEEQSSRPGHGVQGGALHTRSSGLHRLVPAVRKGGRRLVSPMCSPTCCPLPVPPSPRMRAQRVHPSKDSNCEAQELEVVGGDPG